MNASLFEKYVCYPPAEKIEYKIVIVMEVQIKNLY
jgi:hypothetical protein